MGEKGDPRLGGETVKTAGKEHAVRPRLGAPLLPRPPLLPLRPPLPPAGPFLSLCGTSAWQADAEDRLRLAKAVLTFGDGAGFGSFRGAFCSQENHLYSLGRCQGLPFIAQWAWGGFGCLVQKALAALRPQPSAFPSGLPHSSSPSKPLLPLPIPSPIFLEVPVLDLPT